MNPIELFGLLNEISAHYKELDSHGVIAKLIAAEQAVVAAEEAVKAEIEASPKLKELIVKLEHLAQKVALQKHTQATLSQHAQVLAAIAQQAETPTA